MKADKIRGMETVDLEKQLKEIDENMFRIKFQMSLGQTDGLKKYRASRKDRARILTILRERAK
jgi:large subunit ribosomal protein L29